MTILTRSRRQCMGYGRTWLERKYLLLHHLIILFKLPTNWICCYLKGFLSKKTRRSHSCLGLGAAEVLVQELKSVLSWKQPKTTFPTTIKHEKHTIDNRAKISDNSNEFLRSLVKIVKIKILHPIEVLSFKMRNLKGLKNDTTNNNGDFSCRQHSEAVARRCFIKNVSLINSKNSQESTSAGVYFY